MVKHVPNHRRVTIAQDTDPRMVEVCSVVGEAQGNRLNSEGGDFQLDRGPIAFGCSL